jgi:ribulose-phosphate 3-epimerase
MKIGGHRNQRCPHFFESITMAKNRLPQAGTVEIAPSILSADFASEIAQVTSAGVKIVHLDVMDGHFVPNITLGPPVVAWIRKCTNAVLDTHLMITDPRQYAPRFIEAGSDHITFHIETVERPEEFVAELRAAGVTVGVTLNPETPVETIEKVAPLCDMVLVMTVHPGFGGQKFIDEAARKCIRIREIVGTRVRIEVDGGIDATTTPVVVGYGADTLVAGNAIFGQKNRVLALEAIRKSIQG